MLQAEPRDKSQDSAKIWGQRKETEAQAYASLCMTHFPVGSTACLSSSQVLSPFPPFLLSTLPLSSRGFPCLWVSMAQRK